MTNLGKIVWYDGVIDAMLRGQNGFVARDVQRRTLNVHRAAREGCPVNTGRLRSSIRWRLGSDRRGIVGIVSTDVEYFHWVHAGTKAHWITPRFKRALYWKGARHPVKAVYHPGTEANPFLEKALEEASK